MQSQFKVRRDPVLTELMNINMKDLTAYLSVWVNCGRRPTCKENRRNVALLYLNPKFAPTNDASKVLR